MPVICSVFSLSFLYRSYKYMKDFLLKHLKLISTQTSLSLSFLLLYDVSYHGLYGNGKETMLASIGSSKFSSNLSNTDVLCISLSQIEVGCDLTLQMSSMPRIPFAILCSAPVLPFVDLIVSVCHRNSCLWKVHGYCNRAVIIDKVRKHAFFSIFKLIEILLSIYITTKIPRKKWSNAYGCIHLAKIHDKYVDLYHTEANMSGKLCWSGSGMKGQSCYIIRISYRK